MKKRSLIVVTSYTPDLEKKLVEINILKKLQEVRNSFDILLISHTPSTEVSINLVDFFIYDKKNTLIYEPNYKPSFWIKIHNFFIDTTQYFRYTTHLAIFRLMGIANNFAKYMKYEKIHFIEYDLDLQNCDVIYDVDNELNDNDSVVFTLENGWLFGCYFSYKLESHDFLNDFDEEKFKKFLNKTDNNFTEKSIQIELSDGKKIKNLSKEQYFPGRGQLIASLSNDKDLPWSIVYYNEENDSFEFLLNVDKKIEKEIIVLVNNQKSIYYNIKQENEGRYYINYLGTKNEVENVKVYFDKKLNYEIDFTETNKDDYIKCNRKRL